MPYIPAPVNRSVIPAPKVSATFDGRDLQIGLKEELPQNLCAVYYAACDGYFQREDAMRGKMLRVTADRYRQDAGIFMRVPANKQLCVTVVCEYNEPGGCSCFSQAAHLVVETSLPQVISYRISWSRQGRAFGARLYMTTDGTSLPAMRIVCRSDGGIPLGNGPGIKDLYLLPACEERIKVMELPDYIFRGLPPGAFIRLVPIPGETLYFDSPQIPRLPI